MGLKLTSSALFSSVPRPLGHFSPLSFHKGGHEEGHEGTRRHEGNEEGHQEGCRPGSTRHEEGHEGHEGQEVSAPAEIDRRRPASGGRRFFNFSKALSSPYKGEPHSFVPSEL